MPRNKKKRHDKDKTPTSRPDFEQKEDELSSVNVRLTEMETCYKGKLDEAETALKQKDNELNSVKQRLTGMEEMLTEMETWCKGQCGEAEAALKQKEDELNSTRSRLTEMETCYKGKLDEAETALKQKDNELNSVKQRLTGMEEMMTGRLTVSSWTEDKTMTVQSVYNGAAGTETLHKFKPCDTSVSQVETFYQQKLDEMSAALKRKDKELKSFKDRVAQKQKNSERKSMGRLAGDTERMNNPVSKTRLTEMYDKMKLLQWPKVKDQLMSRSVQSKVVQGLIQETFRTAAGEANKRKRQIEEAFGLNAYSSGLTPQKVKEYRQLTVQNLQMALFHTNKEELLKSGFPELGGQFSEEVMVDLRPLTSECYWLSCLMALNNPPLQPDWKNLIPSMDPWDIFPRNITSASVL